MLKRISKIESLGIFAHKKSPKIAWIKINFLQLNKLQKTIDKDIKAFTDYINSIPLKKLFSSELKPFGPVYSEIESYKLI